MFSYCWILESAFRMSARVWLHHHHHRRRREQSSCAAAWYVSEGGYLFVSIVVTFARFRRRRWPAVVRQVLLVYAVTRKHHLTHRVFAGVPMSFLPLVLALWDWGVEQSRERDAVDGPSESLARDMP